MERPDQIRRVLYLDDVPTLGAEDPQRCLSRRGRLRLGLAHFKVLPEGVSRFFRAERPAATKATTTA